MRSVTGIIGNSPEENFSGDEKCFLNQNKPARPSAGKTLNYRTNFFLCFSNILLHSFFVYIFQ